jgi:hypothetical protein
MLRVLTATQGPTAAAVFGATITTAAWKMRRLMVDRVRSGVRKS